MYRSGNAWSTFGLAIVAVTPQMDIEKFDALLDQYGPNVDVWPFAEQELARELLQMSSVAKIKLEEEEALTALLSSHQAPLAPKGLAMKILTKARETS